MSRTHKGNENGVGVELKYCEHCGGLWVRERGAGEVYCEKCQPKIAELPVPRKKPPRVMLPEQRCSVAQKFGWQQLRKRRIWKRWEVWHERNDPVDCGRS